MLYCVNNALRITRSSPPPPQAVFKSANDTSGNSKPIRGHVSWPLVNTTVTRLRLCGSPVNDTATKTRTELRGDHFEARGVAIYSEMYLSLKSRVISLVHNLLLNCQIISKFCTEHGSIIAVLCANCQNDLTTEMDVLDKRDFARFPFKMSFGRITYIITTPPVFTCVTQC